MNVNELTGELIMIGCCGAVLHNHIVRDFSYLKGDFICSWIMLPEDGDKIRFVEIHKANEDKPGVICHTIKCVISHMNGDWEN